MPTITQQIHALSLKSLQLQQVANAYNEGIAIAVQSRRETLIEVKRLAMDSIIQPKTCRHPGARLAPEIRIANRAYEEMARKIDRLIAPDQADDDEIPF
jgi:gamma-glutamyl:cysteine ligase YbdK (ATP-grasp superfamily)